MRILGIDPGFKATGYGFIDYLKPNVKLLEAGIIKPKQRDTLPQKLDCIYRNLSELIDKYNPEKLILEKLYSHAEHPITSTIMGHARGVICLVCEHKNVELVEYSVKRTRKALVGNGNATKLQTKKFVMNYLKINSDIPLDASDALALALGFINMNSRIV